MTIRLLLPRASVGRPPRLALALFAAVLLAGCAGGASSADASPVATTTVDLPRSYKFAPAAIEVTVGETVTWTNDDVFTHSVRFADGGEPLMMAPGKSVSHMFETAGTFHYDCSLHPKDMKGSVLVEKES
jgi:plastocyanin